MTKSRQDKIAKLRKDWMSCHYDHERLWISRGLFFILFIFAATFPAISIQAKEDAVSNLEKALGKGEKNILFSGKENDDITIKKGVSVTGVSIDKAVINADIRMENGSSLSNVTVNGEFTSITVAKGASVTLTNVTVRGGANAGIFAPSGSGTLTLKNSRVIKNRKGLYIEPGKNILISGNQISDNGEEGLDVRAQVTGTITGNEFARNAESGVEVILGSAHITIENNTFSGNRASGLALQSYPNQTKVGAVIVQKNTIADNSDYGIKCDAPSGGGGGKSYFSASIKAVENKLKNNKRGSISSLCGVVNGILVEEVREVEESKVPIEEVAVIDYEGMLSEKAEVLHIREHGLEESLSKTEKSRSLWSRWFTSLASAEQELYSNEFLAIASLRKEISDLPDSGNSEIKEKRDLVIMTSIAREQELNQFFERLKTPIWKRLLQR